MSCLKKYTFAIGTERITTVTVKAVGLENAIDLAWRELERRYANAILGIPGQALALVKRVPVKQARR